MASFLFLFQFAALEINQNNGPQFDAVAPAPVAQMPARAYVNPNENFQNPEMYRGRGKFLKFYIIQ